jgi:hypothetical protein
MAEVLAAFRHVDAEKKDDKALATEAKAHLVAQPTKHFVAELLKTLRGAALPWWSNETLRATWPASERMKWLAQRPDLRQQVVVAITGMPPRAARKQDPAIQATLIDAVLDEGEAPVAKFEDAFDPADLATYGPVSDIWKEFKAKLPWADSSPAHRKIVLAVLKGLLARKALTPLKLRSAIDNKVWHAKMPLDVRAQIDDARLARERAGEAFQAVHELAIATPEILVDNLPLSDLLPALVAAEETLGFRPKAPGAPATDKPQNTGSSPVPKRDVSETRPAPPVAKGSEATRAGDTPRPMARAEGPRATIEAAPRRGP